MNHNLLYCFLFILCLFISYFTYYILENKNSYSARAELENRLSSKIKEQPRHMKSNTTATIIFWNSMDYM